MGPQHEGILGINRTILQGSLMFLLMACGGGGCSSCDGCGVAPIPGGFPIEHRIPNSAQVRLTEGGIDWLENNTDTLLGLALPDGLNFDVPPITQRIAGFCNVRVCQDGSCVAAAEIRSLNLEPVGPNRVRAVARLELESRICTARDADGSCTASSPGGLPIDTCLGDVRATIDTTRGSRPDIGMVIEVAFDEETQAARVGYTKLTVGGASLEPGRDIQDDDIRISGSGLSSILAGLLNLLKGTLINQIQDQINGAVEEAVEDQLCTTQGEYGCPTGTTADGSGEDAVCRYGDGECVPLLLGTDGQGDLGQAFLGSISPGTHGPGQFVFALGGEGESVNGGLSLFAHGGFISTNRDFTMTPGHNPCVPQLDPPALPAIPRISTFRGNTVAGLAEAPHVGIGLSESYLNHAGYGFFDGGLLCIGAGTALAQQLSTGLFSILIGSIRDLTYPESSEPIAIAVRPQQPPTFEIGQGDEPLLGVELANVELDFYVWSTERYVRIMTWAGDLNVDVDLNVTDGQIVPSIARLEASNATVSNQEDLLREDPEMLASVVGDVIGGAAGMLGDLGGFDLPDIMGIQLQVAEGGIRGIEEDGEEFLGIFANLSEAAPMAFSFPTETRLVVGDLDLSGTGMAIENWGEGEDPRLQVFFEAEGPANVEFEYSWRIDGKPWSDWSTDAEPIISDPILRFQAQHSLEARARVVGESASVDLTPAQADVLVDVLAPDVYLNPDTDGTALLALDVVSSDNLEYRWRGLEGDWSAWESFNGEATLPEAEVSVEVRDEAGNIGSASNALIRGRPNPIAGGGCDCTVPGEQSPMPLAILGLLAFVGFGQRRRRSNNKAN